MDRPTLMRIGELLYGEGRYGAQFAAELTALGEGKPGAKKVSQSQVSTWLNGVAEIPAWVGPLARALARKGQVDLARRSAALAELLAEPEPPPAPPRRRSRIERLRTPHPDDLPDTEPTDA
ncbi:hypothetical protein [Methylorubrum extorquens]|uniref:hypothetical protein n=1 Tax=Methylorubrum extorquens TaxID=408 RepID=UPI0022380356|nr:hypothetical protein [Methylorubrum extorquens]UYW31941.1 hypothetical protein OKB92_23720 [Methylorubrum extorquens]